MSEDVVVGWVVMLLSYLELVLLSLGLRRRVQKIDGENLRSISSAKQSLVIFKSSKRR